MRLKLTNLITFVQLISVRLIIKCSYLYVVSILHHWTKSHFIYLHRGSFLIKSHLGQSQYFTLLYKDISLNKIYIKIFLLTYSPNNPSHVILSRTQKVFPIRCQPLQKGTRKYPHQGPVLTEWEPSWK